MNFSILPSLTIKIRLFVLNGHLDPVTIQLVMVLFGYNLIWIWSYLGVDQNCPAKRHSQMSESAYLIFLLASLDLDFGLSIW